EQLGQPLVRQGKVFLKGTALEIPPRQLLDACQRAASELQRLVEMAFQLPSQAHLSLHDRLVAAPIPPAGVECNEIRANLLRPPEVLPRSRCLTADTQIAAEPLERDG